MGWFDEQVEFRKKHENELLTESFQNMAKAVTGRRIGDGVIDEGADVRSAISQLLKYFHVKEKEIPPKLKSIEDRLDYLLSASGILYRPVHLDKGWQRDAMGAMIGSLKGKTEEETLVITLLPDHRGGYYYIDPSTATPVRVNAAQAERISPDALCFYRSFPMRSLTTKDLWVFMLSSLTGWDFASFALSGLLITLVGMLLPQLNKILMGPVIKGTNQQLLFAVMTFMLCITVGRMLFSSVSGLLQMRIQVKMSSSVSAATMMRVLNLPTSFFRQYSSGELTQYIGYMNQLCTIVVDSLLSTGITGLFSLIYMGQIFLYAPSLVLPSLAVTFLTLFVSLTTTRLQIRVSKEQMHLAAKEHGIVYSLLNGVQKIRLSGAENRAFVKWADIYTQSAALKYYPPWLLRRSRAITTGISLCGTLLIYYFAVTGKVSVEDYYAFNAAYAYVSAAFTSMASVATTIAGIRPTLDLIKPLMDAEPELESNLETVNQLSGSIELSHVSFRYDKDGPLILDDLSLTIPARQYVAIVGKTGCGKSTIMRLLLGFEKPTKGSIFYDRKDTRRLDMRSVRKKIGTVMQDGKIFQGSIYENIVITDPTLGLEDAKRAAEISGLSEDIDHMPMGMHTMLSEGSGGISGGQRQRLMIARAVAPKPKILFLDEATSALDNITQKNVSEALDQMRCTRIVIAHRLSTIRHCDRILVLDQGKIIEDGTYEELIEKKGFFAELVERQRVDI